LKLSEIEAAVNKLRKVKIGDPVCTTDISSIKNLLNEFAYWCYAQAQNGHLKHPYTPNDVFTEVNNLRNTLNTIPELKYGDFVNPFEHNQLVEALKQASEISNKLMFRGRELIIYDKGKYITDRLKAYRPAYYPEFYRNCINYVGSISYGADKNKWFLDTRAIVDFMGECEGWIDLHRWVGKAKVYIRAFLDSNLIVPRPLVYVAFIKCPNDWISTLPCRVTVAFRRSDVTIVGWVELSYNMESKVYEIEQTIDISDYVDWILVVLRDAWVAWWVYIDLEYVSVEFL